MKKESEFGKGLTYCLGLFLAHAEREIYHEDYNMWFNGASDHLYEIDADGYPDKIQVKVDSLKSLALTFGHGITDTASKSDFNACIQDAKDLLLLIDKYHGVKTIKATWE